MEKGWFDKIEKYIHGEMNDQEEQLFRSQMEVNQELASAYQVYKGVEDDMHNTIAGHEDESALRASLASLNRKYFAPNPDLTVVGGSTVREEPVMGSKRIKIRWNVRYIVAVAAAVTAIMLASVLWLNNDEKIPGENLATHKPDTNSLKSGSAFPDQDTAGIKRAAVPDAEIPKKQAITVKVNAASREALFATYFEPDVLPATTGGPLQKAMQQYEEEDYSGAIESFREADLHAISRGQAEGNSKQVFYKHYYLALSYLANQQPAQSSGLFQQAIRESPDNSFRNKSTWYLALAYLKTGESAKAMQLLHSLAADQSSGDMKIKAQTLLNDIKKSASGN